MIRSIVAGLIVALASVNPASAASCSGADPGLTNVAVKSVTQQGSLNHYLLTGTVVNYGNQKQPSNTLQFVDIYETGQKLNDRGIPPLAPGQAYTFTYDTVRSTGAGNGTSTIVFKLRMRQPAAGPQSDCNRANDTASVTF